MHIRAERLILRLAQPFKIAHGTSTTRENVLVRLEDGPYTGLGEASLPPYYPHSAPDVIAALETPAVAAAFEQPDPLEHLPADLPPPARAALDMAWHDLWGQRQGQPLFRLWNLDPVTCPVSSFTVAMAADETAYRARLRAAAAYPVIKLKLGSGDWQRDLRLVEIAREELDSDLCVDANAAWNVTDAARIIPRLGELGVTFVEQPLAVDADWHALHAALPAEHPPVIADESVQGLDSVGPLIGAVDGINIKLAKCGGLRPARAMITLAREHGMRVLIGCMVESGLGVTAAAHLAPLADYADLDGHLLLAENPFEGVCNVAGRLTLPDTPGLGVKAYAE